MFSASFSYIADKLVLATPTASSIVLIAFVTLVAHFVIAFIALPAVTRWRRHQRMNLPPLAAPRWPLFGCLLSLADDKGTRPYEILAQMSLDHGPVFRFDFGSFPTIIISDAGVLHEAFAKSASCADRPAYPMFFNYGKGIIANTDNEVLRAHRKFYLTCLRSMMGKGKSHMETLLVKEIRHLLSRVDQRRGEPFDPLQDLAHTSANILCSVLFGKHYTLDDVIFKEMLEYLSECYELAGHDNERNFIPLLSYLPATKKARRSMEVCNKLRELNHALILNAEKDYVPNCPRSYVDMYFDHFIHTNQKSGDVVNGHGENRSRYTFDETLETNIGDLMAAGTETTSAVADWGLLLLAIYPDVQIRIQTELEAVVGHDRQPEYHDKPRLPYVQAVIMEVQRIGSVTPLGVPHCVSSDMNLAGWDIPKGMAVMGNIWWINNNPDVWTDPHLFKPERFLTEDQTLIRRDDMTPFSVGRRRCIGEDLATMELFLLFTHLLHQFTISLPADSTAAPNMDVRQGVTRLPCPYKISVISRHGKR